MIKFKGCVIINKLLSNKSIIGHLLALLTIVIWGTTFIATKVLLVDFSPMEILFFRFLMAYLVLLAIKPKFIKPVSWKEEGIFFLASASGISLYQYLENLSLEYTSPSNVSIIIACSAFFTALFSKLILKNEKISKFFFLGFIVSIIGVALVSYTDDASSNTSSIGDLIALSAAVLWGIYSVSVKITSSYQYSPLLVTRRIMFYGTVSLIPFCIFGNQDLSLGRFLDIENLLLMAFLGLLASALCFFTWNLAVNYIGAVKTGLYIYFSPVVTIIFEAIVFSTVPTWLGGLGTVLILIGLYVSSIKTKESKNSCQ